jgi:hypothetical protein
MGRIQNSVKFAEGGDENRGKTGIFGKFDRISEGTHHACVWEANSQDVERHERYSSPHHRAKQ